MNDIHKISPLISLLCQMTNQIFTEVYIQIKPSIHTKIYTQTHDPVYAGSNVNQVKFESGMVIREYINLKK